jgi:hypothetical protein
MTITSNVLARHHVDRSTDTVFIDEVTMVTEFSASTSVLTVGNSGTEFIRSHETELYPSNGDVRIAIIGTLYRDTTRTEHTRETIRLSPEHARALAKQLLIIADAADRAR